MNLSLALDDSLWQKLLALGYRSASYVALHLMDDAAMMAILFC